MGLFKFLGLIFLAIMFIVLLKYILWIIAIGIVIVICGFFIALAYIFR